MKEEVTMATKARLSWPVMFVVAVFLAGVVTPLQAQGPGGISVPPNLDPWVFNFDEYGNGSINNNAMGFQTLIGTLEADPSQPTHPLVLTYHLPALVANGDVSIFDQLNVLDDVIRFTDAQGILNGGTADRMLYYSDNTDADPAGVLADTANPPTNLDSGLAAGATPASRIEVGAEGNNSFVYAI